MRLADIVVTIAAPWMAVLAGLVIPLLSAVVTKDLTGWIQVVILSVLSAAAGVLSQGIGASWSFPLVHTLSQIGLVALVAVASHYGLNVSGVLQKVSSATRGFGFGWKHPGQPLALVGPSGPVGGAAPMVTQYFSTYASPVSTSGGLDSGQSGMLIHDPRTVKLGKNAPVLDPRTLRLRNYLRQLPAPPPSVDWTSKVSSWPMMRNDSVGDCVIAMAGHSIQLWTAWAGDLFVPTDDQIIAAYSAITGYNPADPSSDQGTDENAMLSYWRSTGIAGHKITAWADVDPANLDEVKTAINLFGAVSSGIALPATAQNQVVWDVMGDGRSGSSAPGSWGGHGVPLVGYNETGPLCITWGMVKQMTWRFVQTYIDELHAVVSADFIAASGVDPQGLNLAQLLADLQAIPPLPETAGVR